MIYAHPSLASHAVVDHGGALYLVPLRPGGWAARQPYRGRRKGLVPMLGAEAVLATIGYQPRSGEMARSGPPGELAPETAARRDAGAVKLRLAPEVKSKLLALAEGHPGGASGLVAEWVEAATVAATGKK